MKRGSIVLIGVLVVLAIAVFFVSRQPGEQSISESTGGPLVTYDSASVDKMEIRSTTGSVTLEKQGGKWMMTQPLKFPADEALVSAAVGKGRDLKITTLVSSNPAKQGLYAVDSTATLVHIFANNALTASFRVGKPNSGWTETYVRKEGSDEVFIVQGVLNSTFMKASNDWRDKTIFKTDKNAIRSIKLQYGDTTFALTKRDSVNWVIGVDSTVNSNVTALVSALSTFQADEFVDSTMTSMPKLTATLETEGVQLRFYKRPDGRYYVQATNTPQLYTVQEWKAGQILKRKKDLVPAVTARK